ncbi:tyrosine-type recombinase/integrase [Falsiroseomonas oryzae]|uniref:tyrosine-type recombinase/integrase n=1 Tax=Falsiroseomonas oryzae TaxID=2766473 RepID=UPI0022EAD2B0|nr:tyrosine-type recombinase/integrase [Roseomonas sp. MO-31]
MARYDRRIGRWRANFTLDGRRITNVLRGKDGRPITERSRDAAKRAIAAEQALKETLQEEAAQTPKPGKPGMLEFFGEAVIAYLETLPEGSGNRRNRRDHLSRILRLLPAETPLTEITEGRLVHLLADLRREPLKIYVGGPRLPDAGREQAKYWRPHPQGRLLSEQSVHHHLVSIGAVLRHARQLRALQEVPKLPRAAPPDRLPNPIRPEHLRRLLDAAPQHLRDGMMLGAWLPARQREIWSMTLRHVDLVDGVVRFDADMSKNGEGIAIPIAKPLRPVLERLVTEARAAGRQHLLVWTPPNKGALPRPIRHPKTAWRATLKRAGLENAGYRLHDLKGHWTTELLRRGVVPHLAMELSRHADLETTLRYVRRLSTDTARDAVARLDDVSAA